MIEGVTICEFIKKKNLIKSRSENLLVILMPQQERSKQTLTFSDFYRTQWHGSQSLTGRQWSYGVFWSIYKDVSVHNRGPERLMCNLFFFF